MDEAMMESEANAISLASTALLTDLERRYMDMSTDYHRLKEELKTAQIKIQQYQQQQQQEQSKPNEVAMLQHSLSAKDEQIVQLRNQIQAQQETHKLVQEQKDQLQSHSDTLQEEIRYVRTFAGISALLSFYIYRETP
jgi:chromosome segregation ATPase